MRGFRGNDLNGNWYYGNLAVLKEDGFGRKKGSYISNSVGRPFAYAVRPETVGQFTGMIDKNGVKIFEGDIVEYTFDVPGSVLATENGLKVRKVPVFWSDFRGSFAIGTNVANNDLFKYVRNENTVEVIGNVHQNKELLEV